MKIFGSRPTFVEILEARIAPATLVAIDDANNLLTFDSGDPTDIFETNPVTGLGVGEALVGIDFRPATGDLVGLTGAGKLYTIDPDATATLLSTLAADPADLTNPFAALSGAVFSVDFNPVSDRLRITSDTGMNLRVNVETGSTITDTNLSGGSGHIVGSAYTNNFQGTDTTTLFGIDSASDQLYLQNPPNNGTLVAAGPLGVDTSDQVGFDIETRAEGETAFASLTVGGQSSLYTIDLPTGAATFVGDIGDATTNPIRDISAVIDTVFIAADGKSAFYFDPDNDLVTIKVSKGTLNPRNFLTIQSGGGLQLLGVHLTGELFNGTAINDPNEFNLTSFSLTAVPLKGIPGSDGYASLGYLNATGIDLGKVTIDGDLGQIDAGDPLGFANGSIGGLAVQSMGIFGLATQGAITGASLVSDLAGKVPSITVKTDIVGATIHITGGIDGTLGMLTVGGSIFGGTADDTGSVHAEGDIKTAKIGRDLIGDDGKNSGSVRSEGLLGSITVNGTIAGSVGENSGHILGGTGIGAVTVKFSVLGAGGPGSGSIASRGAIKSVKIGTDLVGGSGDYSGSVYTAAPLVGNVGAIGDVTIGGNLLGFGSYTGVISDATLGNLKVGGDIAGAIISAEGLLGNTDQKKAVAIKSLTVGGNVRFSNIVAGYDVTGVPTNADVEIGKVVVKGDWIASNLIAGVAAGADGQFGSADDERIAGGSASVVSRLASIQIGGQALGTADTDTDIYGFVAEQILAFKVGGGAYPLDKLSMSDIYSIGQTRDFFLNEFILIV